MARAPTIVTLINKHGGIKAAARATGVGYNILQRRYKKAVEERKAEYLVTGRKPNAQVKLKAQPRLKALKTHDATPPKGAKHVFIVTSAQNNTKVFEAGWENLLTYARHRDAKVLVSTFLYNKTAYGHQRLDKGRLKDGPVVENGRAYFDEHIWFDERIVPYICNDRMQLAKGLVFAGELNILPTAERPLRGLEVYTGRASMIVPHAKQDMVSIATLGGDGAKLNFCTGTVTLRNYIQRKEGFKGEFHHIYGALVVEVDEDGHWWVRQLSADSDGTIYDWDMCVKDGKVTSGHRVEAITHGDVHECRIKKSVEVAVWGNGGVMDQLKPRYQFIHDLLDFHSRSHHDIKDPFKMYERHVRGQENVRAEVQNAAVFLRDIDVDDCETVVVDSNHDRHLMKWLTTADARRDPINFQFWSVLTSVILSRIEEGQKFIPLQDAIGITGETVTATFIDANTSFVICKEFGGGIECGMHGDLPWRATVSTFSKLGRRSNTGHGHTAGIIGGAYRSGTYSEDRLGYNDGPSSWSNSGIITYPNSKRAIFTVFNGKARA